MSSGLLNMNFNLTPLLNACGGHSDTALDIISDGNKIGAVYYFGGIAAYRDEPYNVILMRQNLGQFKTLDDVKKHLTNL